MVNNGLQVNGYTAQADSVTSQFDYGTVATTVSILTAGSTNGSATTQAALDTLVQIIAQRGQPVLLSVPTVANGTYTLNFAIEHIGAWKDATGADMLQASIVTNGVNYTFTSAGTTVTWSETLP